MPTLPKLILIVEDEPLVAMDAKASVEACDHMVAAVAGSVAEALDVLKSRRVDGALLDFDLGHETSVRVAEELDKRRIPYAVVTGAPLSVVIGSGIGRDAIHCKPADYGRVLAALAP